MKKIIAATLLAIFCLATASQAQAQLRWGPKLGVCVNALHFDNSLLDADNRAGFTGGLMLQFTAPLIGVGMDASLMYVRRSSKWMYSLTDPSTSATTDVIENVGQSYMAVPVNFKYILSLPGVSKIIAPFIVTGPEFAFLCSKKAVTEALHGKTFDCSWNFGLGLQLVDRLQVAATYGIGLTKAVETVTDISGAGIQGKNRYWTVTAAYLF